jgi:hypothetical protein
VIGGGFGPFFVSPDNHVLEPMSRAKRQEVEIKKRRQRRTVLTQFALWIIVPVGLGWYLFASGKVGISQILHWPPIQILNQFLASLTVTQYLVDFTGIKSEWFGLVIGFFGVLLIVGLIIEQVGKQSGNVLKALFVEMLYQFGFQFIEGAKVLDPKPREAPAEPVSPSYPQSSSPNTPPVKTEPLSGRPMRARQNCDEDTLG